MKRVNTIDNDSQQLLTIAKRCGWYDIQVNLSESKTGYIGMHPNIPSYAYNIPYQGYDKHGSHRCDYGAPLPDYLNCLNAMHRAERYLEAEEWPIYIQELDKLIDNLSSLREFISLDAPIKAKAYYIAITTTT